MDTETNYLKKAGGGHEGVAAESRLVQGEGEEVRGSEAGGSSQTEEMQLVAASNYLKTVITDAKGNAAALQKRIVSELFEERLPFSLAQFNKVVQDNLGASEQAGYVNRVKLLQFIQKKCLVEVDEMIKKREEETAENGNINGNNDLHGSQWEGDGSTSYHAPKFIDDLVTQNGIPRDEEGSSLKQMMHVIAPEGFIKGFARMCT